MRKWIKFPINDISDFNHRLTCLANDFDHALVLTDNYGEASGVYQKWSRFKCLAGFGALDFITCSIKELESYVNCNDWYLGYFSYELKSELFSLRQNSNKATIDFQPLFFFRPRYLIKNEGNIASLGYDDTHDDEASAKEIIDKVRSVHISYNQELTTGVKVRQKVNKSDYHKAVESIKKHILLGNIYEINYCMEFLAEGILNTPQFLFSKMMDLSPMPFSAFLKNDEHYVLCASPERYLKKNGNKVLSMPMKGTSARGNIDAGYVLERNVLQHSDKEQSENIMITDLVRNDLSRVAKPGTVEVDEICGIYPFPGVFQMVSTVSCELKKGIKWAEPIRCSFPMGSMTGAPKQKALELIDQFESGTRGLYSGAIGYITPERDFDFNVVIRTLFYNKESGKASFWVGSAITSQANADDEYNECLLKAGVIMRILNNN